MRKSCRLSAFYFPTAVACRSWFQVLGLEGDASTPLQRFFGTDGWPLCYATLMAASSLSALLRGLQKCEEVIDSLIRSHPISVYALLQIIVSNFLQ